MRASINALHYPFCFAVPLSPEDPALQKQRFLIRRSYLELLNFYHLLLLRHSILPQCKSNVLFFLILVLVNESQSTLFLFLLVLHAYLRRTPKLNYLGKTKRWCSIDHLFQIRKDSSLEVSQGFRH